MPSRSHSRLLVLLLLALPLSAAAADTWEERPEWSELFAKAGVAGTIVVEDQRSGSTWVWNAPRARTRFVPASTFKIPHTLFALDAGVIRDEFQTIEWDGTRQSVPAWNADQSIRSAMRLSVVWVYQALARQLGLEKERSYLRRIGYGNADPGEAVDRFWLEGPLAISAEEQIAFLKRLYRNELPFAVEHQRLVKDLIVVEARPGWILRAKTGWTARLRPQIGWWVGWVEQPEGPVFFAINIDMPDGGADAPKREAIARAVLRSIKALPEN